jgi:tetratricopeptide (TPR) repeat protein
VPCTRRLLAGILLSGLAASEVVAQTGSDPAAALELAIGMAENSLRQRDLQAAESRYREALFEGWVLTSTLELVERRSAEAREALRNAALFAVETRPALQALATAQLELGETASAVPILRGLAGKDPTDVETLRLLAKALAAGGQLEEAGQALDQASAAASDDPEQAFLLATEYLWLKRVDAAEILFKRVVRGRPIPQTHVLIGRAYRDAGEYERARSELRAAISQDPGVRRAHYYLGMVILADAATGPDRLDGAIAEFQQELRGAPQDPLTNDQLGTALLEAGRQTEALSAFETAVREEPRSAFVFHLGRCQLALDRPAEAATSSRRALELAGEQGASEAELAQIHYQLGLVLRRLGSAPEAAAHLAEAKRLTTQGTDTPGERMASGSFGAALDAQNQTSPLSALPPAQRVELRARVKGSLARAYFNLGVLQAQSQRFANAAEFFARAAEVEPDFPQVQSSMGVAYFNARQFDKATGPLTRAVAANPEDAGLSRLLAMSWLNTEAWTKAAGLLRGDPERKTDASLQSAYGLALLRSGQAAEAEKVLAPLFTEQGDPPELGVLLGEAYANQKKYDQATETLDRALQRNPDVAGAHGTLGFIYLRQRRLAEAEAALLTELKGHPTDLRSQQNLALVFDAENRPEEAVRRLRGALQLKPDCADAHYLLGKILLAQGTVAEAVEQLEAAARLAPGDASIHDQLGRAYQMLHRLKAKRGGDDP